MFDDVDGFLAAVKDSGAVGLGGAAFPLWGKLDAICKNQIDTVLVNADELIFHAEYFNAYTLDPAAYKAGFQGLTSDSWTGEQAVISGATMTSDAVKTSTNDIFAAYEILKGGAAE